MDDVSGKSRQLQSAVARVLVGCGREMRTRLEADTAHVAELRAEALAVASLAAKKHAEVFPGEHQALLDAVQCHLELSAEGICLEMSVKAVSKSDLRALARYAAACAGLFLVRQLEAEDPQVRILDLTIVRSEGGRKPHERTARFPLTAAVIVLSDSRASGLQVDSSGPSVQQRLESYGVRVVEKAVIPDDRQRFEELLRHWADELKLDCIISSGGTGLGQRDIAPEVTRALIDREIPGVSETIRAHGQERTPFAMFSRGICGVRNRTLILNLPGSPAGVLESLDAVMPELLHVFAMIKEGGPS